MSPGAPADSRHRVLVVEDEAALAESVAYALEVEGFEVRKLGEEQVRLGDPAQGSWRGDICGLA